MSEIRGAPTCHLGCAVSTTRLRFREIFVPLQADVASTLHQEITRRLGSQSVDTSGLHIVQRALDARQRPPRYVYTVDFTVPTALAQRALNKKMAEPASQVVRHRFALPRPWDGPRPVVIGAGPAGLMAALTLAQAGMPPILLERGTPVEERVRDVSKLYRTGELNLDSNVCFGEGGAGTFSDGKLYTRVGDERVRRVMETLVDRGASANILTENRPHIGTDKLVVLLKNWRDLLTSLGVDVRFGAALSGLDIQSGVLRGVKLRDGTSIETHHAILATGHSARDVWEELLRHGLPLETRPFAVGFRVEHPQAFVDEVRYGRDAEKYELPAADYRLTFNEPGGDKRGVYSFCMCPGGVVVTTPTREGELCINGMSHASRSGRYANSALVVTVGPEDFARAGYQGVFAGVQYQEAAEAKAYQAGGGAFVAPASRLADFVAGQVSGELGKTSYRRGIVPADLATLYPAPVITALRAALQDFNRKMRGFVTNEAQLIGVETRTASPVRVPRGEDYQALGAQGLYPSGEGMGFGGGIVSAALDGLRSAEALLEKVGALRQESVGDA